MCHEPRRGKYDAQIGRFTGVDMLAESTAGLTPYHFAANNPAFYNDPTGLQHIASYLDQYGNKWKNKGVLHGTSHGYTQIDWYMGYEGAGGISGGGGGGGSLGLIQGVFAMSSEGETSYTAIYKQDSKGNWGVNFRWWEEYRSNDNNLLDGVISKEQFFESESSGAIAIPFGLGSSSAALSTSMSASTLGAIGIGALVVIGEEYLRKNDLTKHYITYYKPHKTNPNKVYVGRVSGHGRTPGEVLARYDKTHRMSENYGLAIMDRSISGIMSSLVGNRSMVGSTYGASFGSYAIIRGREQQLMDNFTMRGYTLGNSIRGVSAFNPLGPGYHFASSITFGQIAPYTGYIRYIP